MTTSQAPDIQNPPKQKRGWKTRQRLVRAAKKLFSEKGYEATNTNQISKQAGMSVGIFYKYFRDKREIFLEIYRDYSHNVEAAVLSELESTKWEEVEDMNKAVESLTRTSYESHKVDPGLLHSFAQIALKDPEFQEIRKEIRLLVRKPFERLLEEKREELGLRNPALTAFIIDEASEALIHQIIYFENDFDEDEFIIELAKMVTAYLFHSRD